MHKPSVEKINLSFSMDSSVEKFFKMCTSSHFVHESIKIKRCFPFIGPHTSTWTLFQGSSSTGHGVSSTFGGFCLFGQHGMHAAHRALISLSMPGQNNDLARAFILEALKCPSCNRSSMLPLMAFGTMIRFPHSSKPSSYSSSPFLRRYPTKMSSP